MSETQFLGEKRVGLISQRVNISAFDSAGTCVRASSL
jgi:hypothetical protein